MYKSNTLEKILTKKIKFYKKLNVDDKEELWNILSDYDRYTIQLKVQKETGFGN